MNIQFPQQSQIRTKVVPLPTEDSINKIGKISKEIRGNLADVLFQEFFRKRFQVPASHHDPRVYSYVELLNHIDSGKPIATKNGEILKVSGKRGATAYTESFNSHGVFIDEHFNQEAIEVAHTQLSRTNYPTYFLDDQTLSMLNNSKVSHDIPVDEIDFPLPSMIISLPKGSCEVPNGSELAILSLTKTYEWEPNSVHESAENLGSQGGLYKSTESWSELKKTAYDKINRSSASGEIIPALNVVAVHSDMEQTVIRLPIGDKTFGDLLSVYAKTLTTTGAEYQKIIDTGRDMALERTTTQFIAELAMKILLFMQSKKTEYVTQGNKIKEARYRRGKLMNEAIWGANFIGKNYGSVLTEKGYGTEREGRTLRYHWRQGHIRGQWYGKGRTKYKTVIIDPYPVNLNENE